MVKKPSIIFSGDKMFELRLTIQELFWILFKEWNLDDVFSKVMKHKKKSKVLNSRDKDVQMFWFS